MLKISDSENGGSHEKLIHSLLNFNINSPHLDIICLLLDKCGSERLSINNFWGYLFDSPCRFHELHSFHWCRLLFEFKQCQGSCSGMEINLPLQKYWRKIRTIVVKTTGKQTKATTAKSGII